MCQGLDGVLATTGRVLMVLMRLDQWNAGPRQANKRGYLVVSVLACYVLNPDLVCSFLCLSVSGFRWGFGYHGQGFDVIDAVGPVECRPEAGQ